MKLHKHFPPHLAQLVFKDKEGDIQKINSIDYDLYLWLIYYTHKKYKDDKSLVYEFEYREIKKSFTKKKSIQSIKESLEKIGKLYTKSNYLNSYGDKEVILTKPFEIEIITTDKNISYGFIVKTTDEFMKWFDNPKPKVDVNYNIIYNLKRFMSKPLYLFLRDSLGIYETKNRNVKIDKFRDMMNVLEKKTTNSNFIIELNKSIVLINEYSDINVGYDVIKKRNLRSGISEIVEIKFTIELDEEKPFRKKLEEKNSTEKTSEEDEDKKSIEDNLSDEVDSDTESEYSYEDYLNESIEEEYKKQIDNGLVVKTTPKRYKEGMRKKLLEDDIESKFKFLLLLEGEKNKLRETIEDEKEYEIIYRHNVKAIMLRIDNECCLRDILSFETVTDSISDTIEFIEDNRDNYYYAKVSTNDLTSDYGRI